MSPMRIDIVTVFPEYLNPLGLSLIGKARHDGVLDIRVHDLRQWAEGAHRHVDDTPYGGGPGMVMSAPVWGRALDQLCNEAQDKPLLVIPTPSGSMFKQSTASEWSEEKHIIFACGRYEGIDSRVATHYSLDPSWAGVREVSIGDYVLAGGEVATMVMVEAVTRLIPGILGNPESAPDDSFSRADGCVEGSIFTKPPVWRGLGVPSELLSGNHALIEEWRAADATRRTATNRPDLIND